MVNIIFTLKLFFRDKVYIIQDDFFVLSTVDMKINHNTFHKFVRRDSCFNEMSDSSKDLNLFDFHKVL